MPITISIFLLKIILLKYLFIKYKSVIRFVVLFLGTYLVLSVLYSFYLSLSIRGSYYPDFMTNLVARQSSALISELGYTAEVIPHKTETSMKLIVNQQFLVRIVEGCNAISIIILFISFIIAFAESLKKTALFILAGAVLIYGVNIIRIVILTITLYKYPQHQELLHGVVFPAIIYGMVFLLWMIWVRMLSKTENENE